MKTFILFFAAAGLQGYIIGYFVGKYEGRKEILKKREEMGLSEEDNDVQS